MMYGSEAMIKFRTAYLQAISKCWENPDVTIDGETVSFQTMFTRFPEIVLKEFGFENPWSVDILMDIKDQGKWRPLKPGGWIGPDATISIWLPTPPKTGENFAEAWAKYYDEFPTYLGTKGYRGKQIQKTNSKKGQMEYAEATTSNSQWGVGNWGDFLEFGAAFMKFVTIAWADKQLQKELQSKICFSSDDNTLIIEDGIAIMQYWIGYNTPWNMKIQFKMTDWDEYKSSSNWNKACKRPCTNCEKQLTCCRWYQDRNGNWDWRRPGRTNQQIGKGYIRPREYTNSLKFHIPIAPPVAMYPIDAVALSEYNLTGDQYPFTCP